jgi:hypothetical protein
LREPGNQATLRPLHRGPFDLTHQLERIGIGGTIDLVVRRDGKTTTMAVDIVDVGQPQRQ